MKKLVLKMSLFWPLLWAACSGNDAVSALPASPANPDAAQEFLLLDVNPNSSSSGQDVSPRDYTGRITAWYFGAAT